MKRKGVGKHGGEWHEETFTRIRDALSKAVGRNEIRKVVAHEGMMRSMLNEHGKGSRIPDLLVETNDGDLVPIEIGEVRRPWRWVDFVCVPSPGMTYRCRQVTSIRLAVNP